MMTKSSSTNCTTHVRRLAGSSSWTTKESDCTRYKQCSIMTVNQTRKLSSSMIQTCFLSRQRGISRRATKFASGLFCHQKLTFSFWIVLEFAFLCKKSANIWFDSVLTHCSFRGDFDASLMVFRRLFLNLLSNLKKKKKN